MMIVFFPFFYLNGGFIWESVLIVKLDIYISLRAAHLLLFRLLKCDLRILSRLLFASVSS